MRHMKIYLRAAILPTLGIFLLAGGCGAGSGASMPPEVGQQRKQARINAYGPSGIPKETRTRTNNDPQASARAKAQQGGR